MISQEQALTLLERRHTYKAFNHETIRDLCETIINLHERVADLEGRCMRVAEFQQDLMRRETLPQLSAVDRMFIVDEIGWCLDG